MDIEQLKEMVNSTIVENGRQEITGASLNLALNSIIDSISEIASNSSSGSFVFTVLGTIDNLDEALNPTTNLDVAAANKAVFDKFYEAYLNGEYPLVTILTSLEGGSGVPSGSLVFSPSVSTVYFGNTSDAFGVDLEAFLIYIHIASRTLTQVMLFSNGSCIIE